MQRIMHIRWHIYVSKKCLLAYETPRVQGMKKIYVYISTGSCVRVSRPPTRACISALVVLRTPNPLRPGPRGCLTTPLDISFKFPLIEPITLGGRLGTGGTELFPKLLPNRDPKPPGERRDGEAMVA